jgi:hypothetical protein
MLSLFLILLHQVGGEVAVVEEDEVAVDELLYLLRVAQVDEVVAVEV